MEHSVRIEYCPRCKWLLRASWMAQELLSTFESDIHALTLKPADSGVYRIYVNEILIWDRKAEGGFPEITELKRRVRNIIAPDKNLGHSEIPK